MKKIILYTTLGCHLCEQVERMLSAINQPSWFVCESIEIVENHHLLEKYGTSIPVLQDAKTKEALYWPFSIEQLQSWLK